ncbi:catechol-2,3-dioxygenase [Reticulibacter mediterranei]|uniref:Catechol-2,3-dioxygenase n=1 Tax=Reticulibacter mediterranei TaxID=2778369 RepID=A0A8J3IWP1_9CHLR|nr:VOC family protein [Reticulibacter mediterranei]GHO98205.1 catechol-2,3-dioxygenase [Reticulibacter mediterranei]
MDSQTQTNQQTARLHSGTYIGSAALTIADLQRSIEFYTRVIGFTVLMQTEQTAVLGTLANGEQKPLLTLVLQSTAKPQPARSTGLYHIAVLLPSRADLSLFVLRLATSGYPLSGVADHLVSEALYLSDPDGNGLEVYRDRPRETWQWHNGLVQMATDPLDVEALLTEGQELAAGENWHKAPAGTTIGHMHLRVGDIEQARHFYADLLGFDVVQHLPGALFVSAGGYHHHLGLNIWQSRNAPRPPADSAGLRLFTIELPDAEGLAQLQQRLRTAQWPFEHHEGEIVVRDPWENPVLVTTKALTTDETVSRNESVRAS